MLTIGEQLMAEGEARLLTTLMHHKFSTVSDEVQTRVDQASLRRAEPVGHPRAGCRIARSGGRVVG